MATTASTEASEIRRRGRRRLIGAVVLVVLAVVFVPMVLDSEPRARQGQLSTDIPPKDNAPPLPPPAPSKAAATVPKAEPVAPAKAGAQDARAQAAAETPGKAVIPPETAKAVAAVDPANVVVPVKPASTKAPAAPAQTPKLEGFAIQVGAFKDEEKLATARQKLASARIPHFVERRGDLNRLRAGPYPSREAAEKALASVKAASLDGQVVPLP